LLLCHSVFAARPGSRRSAGLLREYETFLSLPPSLLEPTRTFWYTSFLLSSFFDFQSGGKSADLLIRAMAGRDLPPALVFLTRFFPLGPLSLFPAPGSTSLKVNGMPGQWHASLDFCDRVPDPPGCLAVAGVFVSLFPSWFLDLLHRDVPPPVRLPGAVFELIRETLSSSCFFSPRALLAPPSFLFEPFRQNDNLIGLDVLLDPPLTPLQVLFSEQAGPASFG